MPNIAGLTRWTTRDEEQLRMLTERKAAYDEARLEPLITYMQGVPKVFYSDPSYARGRQIAEWMVADADTIRDLLLPFDSGVRPAQPSKV